jgi:reactive intermediate/imine deaminase
MISNAVRAALFALIFALTGALTAQERPQRVNVEGLGRLPAFSHASVHGDLIFVSGSLGTVGDGFDLAEGVGAQTTQTLENIERILHACGATRHDVLKVNVFLTDMNLFNEMNEAYIAFFGDAPPARTTAGVSALALGALVEIEAIARNPESAAVESRPIPAPPTTGFLETPDGERLYYEVTGEGEPIIFSHGLGGNHAVWYQQVADLAFDFQVVTWDQRGFGQSTNVNDEAGPDAFARDLGVLMDHLGIESAHLVGQSMGGWTVMAFALDQPERTRSLTFADTIAGIYTPRIEAAFDAYIRSMLAGGEPAHLGNHPALGAQLAREKTFPGPSSTARSPDRARRPHAGCPESFAIQPLT